MAISWWSMSRVTTAINGGFLVIPHASIGLPMRLGCWEVLVWRDRSVRFTIITFVRHLINSSQDYRVPICGWEAVSNGSQSVQVERMAKQILRGWGLGHWAYMCGQRNSSINLQLLTSTWPSVLLARLSHWTVQYLHPSGGRYNPRTSRHAGFCPTDTGNPI